MLNHLLSSPRDTLPGRWNLIKVLLPPGNNDCDVAFWTMFSFAFLKFISYIPPSRLDSKYYAEVRLIGFWTEIKIAYDWNLQSKNLKCWILILDLKGSKMNLWSIWDYVEDSDQCVSKFSTSLLVIYSTTSISTFHEWNFGFWRLTSERRNWWYSPERPERW